MRFCAVGNAKSVAHAGDNMTVYCTVTCEK